MAEKLATWIQEDIEAALTHDAPSADSDAAVNPA